MVSSSMRIGEPGGRRLDDLPVGLALGPRLGVAPVLLEPLVDQRRGPLEGLEVGVVDVEPRGEVEHAHGRRHVGRVEPRRRHRVERGVERRVVLLRSSLTGQSVRGRRRPTARTRERRRHALARGEGDDGAVAAVAAAAGDLRSGMPHRGFGTPDAGVRWSRAGSRGSARVAGLTARVTWTSWRAPSRMRVTRRLVAGGHLADLGDEGGRGVDRLAVDGDDDVAVLDAGRWRRGCRR